MSLIQISNAQLRGFIAIATCAYGEQVGKLAGYMKYGDKAKKCQFDDISLIGPMIKAIDYVVSDNAASFITVQVPDSVILSFLSVSVTGYGVIGNTSWQGSQSLTAIDLANNINAGAFFVATAYPTYVTVSAPLSLGSSFNGTTAVVSAGFVSPPIPEVQAVSVQFGPINDIPLGTYTVTVNWSGAPIVITSNQPTLAAARADIVSQFSVEPNGFRMTNSAATSLRAPVGTGSTPNGVWSAVWTGSYIGAPGVNNLFSAGVNFTPGISFGTNTDVSFAGGDDDVTWCLNYDQVFSMMQFISKRLGFCYDLNQTLPLN